MDASGEGSGPQAMHHPQGPSFGDSRFVLLLAGQTVNSIGGWASAIVLWGFAAYRFNASPYAVSVTITCWAAPPALLSPLLGVFIDRIGPRPQRWLATAVRPAPLPAWLLPGRWRSWPSPPPPTAAPGRWPARRPARCPADRGRRGSARRQRPARRRRLRRPGRRAAHRQCCPGSVRVPGRVHCRCGQLPGRRGRDRGAPAPAWPRARAPHRALRLVAAAVRRTPPGNPRPCRGLTLATLGVRTGAPTLAGVAL